MFGFNIKILTNDWVCPYLTQPWVETTQHLMDTVYLIIFGHLPIKT